MRGVSSPVFSNTDCKNNRVLEFISSESHGEKVFMQQERVLAALDAAKIDLKKNGNLPSEEES